MTTDEFAPVDFDPPTSLITDQFRLEPLGPQHVQADHAAWTSSIEHIRSTPGYPDGNWPPRNGMTLEENLSDLGRHADDFKRAPVTPSPSWTRATTTSSVASTCTLGLRGVERHGAILGRADRSNLDVSLADAVARWLAADWPWKRVNRCGR